MDASRMLRRARRLFLSVYGIGALLEFALALADISYRHWSGIGWLVLVGALFLQIRGLQLRVEDLTPNNTFDWPDFKQAVAGNLIDVDPVELDYALDLAIAPTLAEARR